MPSQNLCFLELKNNRNKLHYLQENKDKFIRAITEAVIEYIPDSNSSLASLDLKFELSGVSYPHQTGQVAPKTIDRMQAIIAYLAKSNVNEELAKLIENKLQKLMEQDEVFKSSLLGCFSREPPVIKSSFFLMNSNDMEIIDNVDEDGGNTALYSLDLIKKSSYLPFLISYYSEQLEQINPASFAFLSPQQKVAMRNQLRYTFYLLYVQYQIDSKLQVYQNLKKYKEGMASCTKLMNQLENSSANQIQDPEKQLETAISSTEKLLKLLGMTLVAKWLSEKIVELSDSPSTFLKDMVTEMDNCQFYLGCEQGLLSSILELLPTNFFYGNQANNSLNGISPAAGYVGWLIYYVRFGLDLFLLLRHAIKGPWMHKKEKELPPEDQWECFKTQWDQRKFNLISDFSWGTAGLLCFYWLTGVKKAGYVGNIVTVSVYLVALAVAAWAYWEESTKHNKKVALIQEDISELNKKRNELCERIRVLEEQRVTKSENPIQIGGEKVLKEELMILEKEIKKCVQMKEKMEFDWSYQRKALINDMAFAASWVIAGVVISCFLFPPAAIAPGTVLIIGLVGAALGVVINAIYSAVSNGLVVAKTKKIREQTKEEYRLLSIQFQECNDEEIKKQLYLEMKRLQNTIDYQNRLVNFQTMQLLRSTFIDAFSPIVLFTAFVFMPVGIGIGVLATAFAVSSLSNFYIKKLEPKAPELPKFILEDYEPFAKGLNIKNVLEDAKIDPEKYNIANLQQNKKLREAIIQFNQECNELNLSEEQKTSLALYKKQTIELALQGENNFKVNYQHIETKAVKSINNNSFTQFARTTRNNMLTTLKTCSTFVSMDLASKQKRVGFFHNAKKELVPSSVCMKEILNKVNEEDEIDDFASFLACT